MAWNSRIVAVVAVLAATGCQNTYYVQDPYAAPSGNPSGSQYGLGGMSTKQTLGALGGAAAGGLLGSQIGKGTGNAAATGAGVLLGALLGQQIGSALDRSDSLAADDAFDRASAAPVGETNRWNNPDTGRYGTVTPVREGQTDTGRVCREYETTIQVDGRPRTGTGTACRNRDGTWEIVG